MPSRQQLIIGFSGKKQSGKSTGTNFVLSEFVNHRLGKKRFLIDKGNIIDSFDGNKEVDLSIPSKEVQNFWDTYDVKVYSFSDPLKQFLINVFGLDPKQCYGSDDDKNSPTHLEWEKQFQEVREKYSRPRRRTGDTKLPTGYMSGREIMQVFGTDWCRKIDENCWARGLYSIIQNEGYRLAIITDIRFPNEVTLGTEIGAKIIRLTRSIYKDNHPSETALDDMPMGEYSAVIDNKNISMREKNDILLPKINGWFNSHRLFS